MGDPIGEKGKEDGKARPLEPCFGRRGNDGAESCAVGIVVVAALLLLRHRQPLATGAQSLGARVDFFLLSRRSYCVAGCCADEGDQQHQGIPQERAVEYAAGPGALIAGVGQSFGLVEPHGQRQLVDTNHGVNCIGWKQVRCQKRKKYKGKQPPGEGERKEEEGEKERENRERRKQGQNRRCSEGGGR